MTVISINSYSDVSLKPESLISMYAEVYRSKNATSLTTQELNNRVSHFHEIPSDIKEILRNKEIVILSVNSKTDYSLLKDLPIGGYKLFLINNVFLDISEFNSDPNTINGYNDLCSRAYDLTILINSGLGKNSLKFLYNDFVLRVSNYLPKITNDYEISVFKYTSSFKHTNGTEIIGLGGKLKPSYIIRQKKDLQSYVRNQKGSQAFDSKMYDIFSESGYAIISENDLVL